MDTQPLPRRVSSLKSKIVVVAAANKHTAVISESGEVFTWGCNKDGQLGYGTSNSASNYTPRVVEYLKGKVLRGVAAAKYHTIVLGSDGEVTFKYIYVIVIFFSLFFFPNKFIHLVECVAVIHLGSPTCHSKTGSHY